MDLQQFHQSNKQSKQDRKKMHLDFLVNTEKGFIRSLYNNA